MPKFAIEPKVATFQGSLLDTRGGPGTIVGNFELANKSIAVATSANTGVEESIDRSPGSSTEVVLPLSKLCLTRSGDKGDSVNIGVMARSNAAL